MSTTTTPKMVYPETVEIGDTYRVAAGTMFHRAVTVIDVETFRPTGGGALNAYVTYDDGSTDVIYAGQNRGYTI